MEDPELQCFSAINASASGTRQSYQQTNNSITRLAPVKEVKDFIDSVFLTCNNDNEPTILVTDEDS
jgi:hypothetical protein